MRGCLYLDVAYAKVHMYKKLDRMFQLSKYTKFNVKARSHNNGRSIST